MRVISFILAILVIEFLDEWVYGAKEAAWPLIRNDLNLDYTQIGLLLSIPNLVGNLVEPVIGILGDGWMRKKLIIGGGVVYSLALVLTALNKNFWLLLGSFILFYPASGAFVSLSQAALMDVEPDRHEQNMARWTFAGSLGIVAGPLFLWAVTYLGLSWRWVFGVFAMFSTCTVLIVKKYPAATWILKEYSSNSAKPPILGWREGVSDAIRAIKRREVIRWLVILEFADLTLDIFHSYMALYFVDVAQMNPGEAGLAVAIWTGAGLVGDFLLIPILEVMNGLVYLRISAVLVLIIFPVFLLVPGPSIKLVLVAILGFLNAGWYAIPKGRLYTSMPNQSGTVMAVGNVSSFFGALIPLGIGMVAQKFGLSNAMWLVLFGPITLIIGLPKNHRPINNL